MSTQPTSSPCALFLEATDVWLFRDAKPFSAGSDRRARSLFPPTGQTLQGAFRAAVLSHLGLPLECYRAASADSTDPLLLEAVRQIGFATEQPLKLAGPWIALRDGAEQLQAFHPVPLNLVEWVTEELRHPVPLVPRWEDKGWTNSPLESRGHELGGGYRLGLASYPEADGEWEEPRGYVSREALCAWLAGRQGALTPRARSRQPDSGLGGGNDLADLASSRQWVIDPEELIGWELRTGVAMDASRRASAEGLLYQAEFVRPRQQPHPLGLSTVGVVVSVESPIDWSAWSSEGLLALGGESRAARYTRLKAEQASRLFQFPVPEEVIRSIKEQRRLALYLATPAVFTQGWCPDGIDPRTGEGSLGDVRVSLKTAAVGRYQPIGGWDLARQQPKPLRPAVPAGSIYYFEVLDDLEEADVRKWAGGLQATSLVHDEQDARLGLGTALLAVWGG